MAHLELVEKVMTALEKFYDDGNESGEDMFNKFASQHAHHFSKESSATGGENNLAWT